MLGAKKAAKPTVREAWKGRKTPFPLFDHYSFDDSELCLRWFMLMAIRAIALILNASQMLPGREG